MTDNSTSIDDHGWQVTDMARDLYPGGPCALHVTSPDYPDFYTGWRHGYIPDLDRDIGRYLIISHIGGRCSGIQKSRRLFSQQDLSIIQQRLFSYARQHWQAVTGKTVAYVEFRDEDMQVEIF